MCGRLCGIAWRYFPVVGCIKEYPIWVWITYGNSGLGNHDSHFPLQSRFGLITLKQSPWGFVCADWLSNKSHPKNEKGMWVNRLFPPASVLWGHWIEWDLFVILGFSLCYYNHRNIQFHCTPVLSRLRFDLCPSKTQHVLQVITSSLMAEMYISNEIKSDVV